jgi:hypothetical protein
MHQILRIVATVFSIAASSVAGAQGQSPASNPPAIQREALSILKAMSDKLAGAQKLSFTAVGMFDLPAGNGQPLFYATSTSVVLERPGKLKVIASGDGRSSEFYADGQTMTVFLPDQNVVAESKAPADIDSLIDQADQTAGINFPFVDFIVSDPYAEMTRDVDAAFVIGRSTAIGGTTTDIVAVSNRDVQAQLWIGADDKLPRLIWATSTDTPEKPRHSIQFSDWKMDGAVTDASFGSARLSGARRIELARPETLSSGPN